MIRWKPVVATVLVLLGLSALSPFVAGDLPPAYQWSLDALGQLTWPELPATIPQALADPWVVAGLVVLVLSLALIAVSRLRRPPSGKSLAEFSGDEDRSDPHDPRAAVSALAQQGADVAVIARQTQLAQDAVRGLLTLQEGASGAGGTNFRMVTKATDRGTRDALEQYA